MRLITRGPRSFRRVLYDNEDHYVAFIRQAIDAAFPGYRCLAANMLVESPAGDRAVPDLVLLERDYRTWFVVEVELSTHSLHGHVVPQVEILATGRYGEEHARSLHEQNSGLNLARLTKVVTRVHPEVMVIVNDADVVSEGWAVLRDQKMAHLTFLEVFREEVGSDGPIAFWSGFEPTAPSPDHVIARPHRLLNALVIEKPVRLLEPSLDDVTIEYKSALVSWSVVHTADQVLLQPSTRLDLRQHPSYRLQKLNPSGLRLTVNRT